MNEINGGMSWLSGEVDCFEKIPHILSIRKFKHEQFDFQVTEIIHIPTNEKGPLEDFRVLLWTRCPFSTMVVNGFMNPIAW